MRFGLDRAARNQRARMRHGARSLEVDVSRTDVHHFAGGLASIGIDRSRCATDAVLLLRKLVTIDLGALLRAQFAHELEAAQYRPIVETLVLRQLFGSIVFQIGRAS